MRQMFGFAGGDRFETLNLSRKKEEQAMRTTRMLNGLALCLALITSIWAADVLAATNQATDGGGAITLTASGNVTVNSATMQLVKQVWTTAGACLASSPADAACNASATTVTVAAGTQLKFVIFVKNATDLALSDVRFQDALDVTATGFTYVAGTLKHDATQLDSATSAQIYAAVDIGTADTDAVDVGGTNYASITGAPASNITVGAVVGQVNAALNVNARRTFALEFQARKN
jgi:uncharacterized repeat protein (TIGR01451 family)